MSSSKRGPSVLVTDSRDRPPKRGSPQRASASSATAGSSSRMPMRFISVDNVLQFSSDIPSGQPRLPPCITRPGRAPTARRGSHSGGSIGGGLGGLGGGLGGGGGGGGGLPTLASARTGQQNVPSRTTKVSEKLVLLPEAPGDGDDEDEGDGLPGDDELARHALPFQEENRPLNNEELDVLRKRGGIRGKSFAERLPKKQRADKGFSRVTAYCTAQAYRMKATAEFVRTKHEAKTKLYDDCLYVVYHMPLLPGIEGHRVRSRPILKTPGTGKTVLDLEIERSERRDEHEGFLDDFSYAVQGADGHSPGANVPPRLVPIAMATQGNGHDDTGQVSLDSPPSPLNRLVPDVKTFAEMFVFSYGVVVFWNFSERQEKDILADLTFAGSNAGSNAGGGTGGSSKSEFSPPRPGRGGASDSIGGGVTGTGSTSLVTRPLHEGDFETEEFHFEYSADVKRPRVFNDMITLLPRSDHMVKLTISHAIAQSTKLCLFEERMSETMLDAQYVPKRLALTGELNMTRTEIVRILGRLFTSRVDINLSSNILDVPNFFWDSEPTLHPLYVAIREYLEIDPRIKVLNERCRVFLDLAEILSDSVADAKMSAITWIIIILIVVSIGVTSGELILRMGLLEKGKTSRGDGVGIKGSLFSSSGSNIGTDYAIISTAVSPAAVSSVAPPSAALVGGAERGDAPDQGQKTMDFRALVKGGRLANVNITIEDLRLWADMLSEGEKTAICGADYIGKTFAGV